MDPDTGEPKDDLLPEAKSLIAKLGSSCTKVSEVLANKDEKVYSEITAGLERANKHAVSHAQRVQNIEKQLLYTDLVLTICPSVGAKVHHFKGGLLCAWW